MENVYDSTAKVKRILCYGDSNTWGWVPSSMGSKRYDKNNRWTGVLQNRLGENYHVIEEGLGARTTNFDDPRPEFPLRNGAETLPIMLESHAPLSVVVLMLGTTDAKEMLHLTVEDITEGMRKLVKIVKSIKTLEHCSLPKILIIVPAIVNEEADFASKLFKGATLKTQDLIEAYKKLADEEQVYYLNPTNQVNVDAFEGVHLDNKNHKKLGKLIAEKILEIT
ncbi:hydrolase [Candidatus Woesearchaeota archaeon]|nr:MAG: hydrolase [Candidatus Woesearchaeota archaeon]